MKIETIIYETTKGLLNIEDKLSIATLFLFCEKIGSRKLAELLYTDDVEGFIQDIQNEVDFSVRLDNKNIKDAFFKTIEKYKKKNDSDGFLKAVFEKEPYTLAICDIVEQKK